MRSNGGFIGGKKTSNTSVASGIWAIRDQQREKGASNWPVFTGFIDFLAVGGGANGGPANCNVHWSVGGGGGGSNYKANHQFTSSTNYAVVVGGAGSNSSFDGNTGGSGNAGTAGPGGGSGGTGGNQGANGGQGAGSFSGASGTGASGFTTSITGSSVCYGGGGSAGGEGGTNCGGGAGTQAGTVNRGGGGGGGYPCGGGPGAGGSGIVIVRYLSTYTITIGAGLTGTTATDGSHKVTTITAGSGNVSWA